MKNIIARSVLVVLIHLCNMISDTSTFQHILESYWTMPFRQLLPSIILVYLAYFQPSLSSAIPTSDKTPLKIILFKVNLWVPSYASVSSPSSYSSYCPPPNSFCVLSTPHSTNHTSSSSSSSFCGTTVQEG
jgi:hypothetical protein